MAPKTAKKVKKARGLGARYFYNERGEPTEVLLPIALYRKLVEQAEELEEVRAFDEAVKDAGTIPWEEARKQLGL